MAGKTDTTKLQFLFKKALGFANTSNLKTDAEETAGSSWQLGSSFIFAQSIPSNPSTNDSDINTIQSDTVEYTILTASVVPGSTYNANDTGGGGSEGSQSSGPHCYSFSLNTVYQANSSNPKKGTGSFTNGMALSASNGAVQIVSTAFSTQSPNPYLLKLFEDDGSGGLGTQIFPTAEVDWYLDAYNGILFIQDYEAATLPKYAKAFIYTGDFVSNFTGDAMAVSGSAGGKTSKILLMSGSGNDSNTVHSVSDVAYTGDPANYVDTTFYVSGAVGAISDNKAGATVMGGDTYISGALYLAELRTGVIPGNPPDGRIALYGKDDSGVTKIYFRNESGESEIATGGGGSAGGSSTQVQYNNAGSLDGISGLTSDGTNATFGDTSLLVGQDIIHDGDSDTLVRFEADKVQVNAGGQSMLYMREDGASSHVLILSGGAVDAPNPYGFTDTSFFVSGALGSIGSAIRGTSVFGGDLVSSGAVSIGAGSVGISTLSVYANVSDDYAATIDNDQSSEGHVLKLLTDGNGSNSRILEMEDGDGDILFRARADGRFGFGANGVSSMGAGTFVVGIDGSHTADIAISKRLQHLGDSDTFMDFPSVDQIEFQAGGLNMVRMVESSNTGQVLILSGGGVTSKDEAGYLDTNFFVSGSINAKSGSLMGSNSRGVTTFGGDIVVSGSLWVTGSIVENELQESITSKKTITFAAGSWVVSNTDNQAVEIDSFSIFDYFSVRYFVTGKPTNANDRFNSSLMIAFDGRPNASTVPSFAENRAQISVDPADGSSTDYLSSDKLAFTMTQGDGVVKLYVSGTQYYSDATDGTSTSRTLSLVINRVAYRL